MFFFKQYCIHMIQNCFIPGVVFILPLLFSHHGIQTTATDDVEIHGDFSSLERLPIHSLFIFNDVQVVNIKTYRLASWKTTPQRTCPLETSPCLNDAHAEWNLDWSPPKVFAAWSERIYSGSNHRNKHTKRHAPCGERSCMILHRVYSSVKSQKWSPMNTKKNSMPASASLEMPTPLRGFSPTHPVLPGARASTKMLPVPKKLRCLMP